jgi:hypothetical protein
MAKLLGDIKFTGKIDGLSFYELNGKIVVRKTGGFDGKKIKEDPKFAKVRQNSTEFGHCAKVGRALRLSLGGATKKLKEPYLHNKIVSLLRNAVKLDTLNERGQRNIGDALKNTEAKKMFQGFELSTTYKCSDFINAKYNLIPEAPVKLDIQIQNFLVPTPNHIMRIRYYWIALNLETLESKTTMSGALELTAQTIKNQSNTISFINTEIDSTKNYFLIEEFWYDNADKNAPITEQRGIRIIGVI